MRNRALDILGDMLCNSLFDEKELKKELGVILEEIDMYEDSPEDLVHEHLQMAVWENPSVGVSHFRGKANRFRFYKREDSGIF